MIENSPFIMTVIVHHLYLHVKYACAVSPLFLEAGQALTHGIGIFFLDVVTRRLFFP